MGNLFFIKQYIIKPRTVGAVLPSSQRLAKKMIEDINFSKAQYIIEYGPGTGVFTQKLIQNRKKGAILLVIEYNRKFYKLLKEKYKHIENMYIINDSAEAVDKYIYKYDIPYADYVVSGLPFASLPQSVSNNILSKTGSILKDNGRFITFQYTLLKKNLIEQYFKNIDIKREFWNMPPAYVLSCSKPYFYDKPS